MENVAAVWRKCSSCKKPIALKADYYVCSVSTCNQQRTGYVFCTIPCFERHLPTARHRDAGAIEKVAPSTVEQLDPTSSSSSAAASAATAATTSSQAPSNASQARAPERRFVTSTPSHGPSPASAHSSKNPSSPREVLVIASRLKEYIQNRSDFNTSGGVMEVLSDHLRILCDRAIDNARADGRKTVMDRDFDFLKNLR